MKSLEVNQNGFVNIPEGYHLHITNTGHTMLVRDESLFKEGDVIEYLQYNCRYCAIVDHINNEGCICYKILIDYSDLSVHFNSSASIIQDNWHKVPESSSVYTMMKILYENCRNK